MQFQQSPPALGNQYEDDRVLRSYVSRVLPKDVLNDVEDSLTEMGRSAGSELYDFQLADRLNEPTLTQWSRGEVGQIRSSHRLARAPA